MKIVAIVQARMGSTRLPGKVLMDLGGQPVLCRVVHRLRRSTMLADVVIATTDSKRDDVLVQLCHGHGFATFRGSEDDVLDRYYRAATSCEADAVVRVTSDCPLIDPELVDQVIHEFLVKNAEYASNVLVRSYPRGLDCEVFTMSALERVWRTAIEPHRREHVTPFFYESPSLFRMASVTGEHDYSHYRWTLDTPEDLQLIRAIYSSFGERDDFSWRETIALMQRVPELHAMNANIMQKPLHVQAAS
jgi:spore coat polysaccharide biosynthesis protein SpsF